MGGGGGGGGGGGKNFKYASEMHYYRLGGLGSAMLI